MPVSKGAIRSKVSVSSGTSAGERLGTPVSDDVERSAGIDAHRGPPFFRPQIEISCPRAFNARLTAGIVLAGMSDPHLSASVYEANRSFSSPMRSVYDHSFTFVGETLGTRTS